MEVAIIPTPSDHGQFSASGIVPNPFLRLLESIKSILGPTCGLDSQHINPDDLVSLMEDYNSDPADWLQYAWSDASRAYTRNLVDDGNGKMNLLILVWGPGKTSPVHDHANAHCIMKVLRGSLRETLYENPTSSAASTGPLTVTKETTYMENQVTYISDKIGLHKICNPDPDQVAISLHRKQLQLFAESNPDMWVVYTPPHAYHFGCHIFNETTGNMTHAKQCDFFSRYGYR